MNQHGRKPDGTIPEPSLLLVGLSNPATMGRLAHLSSLLAPVGSFDLLLTHVVTVASQISLTSGAGSPDTVRARDFLEDALREVESFGVRARALVELARSVDEGLVAASKSREASLILVGYSEEGAEEDDRKEKRFDRTMHRLARHADCDLIVAKFRKQELKNILVPLGADPDLRVTGLLCHALAPLDGASLRFIHLPSPGVPLGPSRERMEGILASAGLLDLGELEVTASDDVVATIEARADDHDVVIVGPKGSSSPMDALFTSTGEKIAERVPCSVFLTKPK